MTEKSKERKITILDWGILLAVLVMLVVIYIPSSIWKEEARDRSESRYRMEVINNAAQFFKELTGSYSTNGNDIFALVEAAMDSLIADSLFTGDRQIHVNGKVFQVNMEKGLETRIDTTFSHAQILKQTYVDTIFDVTKINIETGGLDTISVGETKIEEVKQDPFFNEIVKIEVTSRVEEFADYLRDKYHLNPDLLVCPLSGKPYILEVDSSDPEQEIFTVKSPVPADYKEPRYGIFKYESGDHGSIVNGETSWAER